MKRGGLAAVASAAFVAQCLARGLVPAYSAAGDNTPSLALAGALGFTYLDEIAGYPLERSFELGDGLWGPPPS